MDFSWLGDVMGDIGNVMGNVWDTVGDTNWTEVLSSSIMPSIIGAGVGALASAVSDGDMTEGLLFGAAGGLALGGLSNFGSQFTSNWSMTTTPGYGNVTLGGASLDWKDTGGYDLMAEGDTDVLASMGITLPDAGGVVGDTGMFESLKEAVTPSSSGAWWDFAKSEGGASLILGGAKFVGDLLSEDEVTEAQLLERQMDTEEDRFNSRRNALAGFQTETGDYVETTSVPDAIRQRATTSTNATKSEMGVNLGDGNG